MDLGHGGRLAVLEFAIPTTPVVRAAYLFYFNAILPRIGRLAQGAPITIIQTIRPPDSPDSPDSSAEAKP